MKVNEKLSVLFLLEKSKASKNGMSPIWGRITVTGSPRAEFSLGKKVSSQWWDQQNERVILKDNPNVKEARQINSAITLALAEIQKLYTVIEHQQGFVTSDLIKQAYKDSTTQKEEIFEQKLAAINRPQEKTLCQVCNYKYSKFAVLVKAGERSPNTLKRWRTTKRKIRQFLKFKFKKWDVPISMIKFSHAEDFLHFLLTQHRIKKNTSGKYMKNFRELLQIANNQEWVLKNPWHGYKISYVQPDRECLSMQEIIWLYQKPLIERLDHVRNVFLFACFTGYAFQEVQNLSKDDIFIGVDGKRWIKIDRQKTGNPECIPLLPIPASIVDRYANDPYCVSNNKLLPVKSYHNYNGYLKEVAYICEISIELSTHIARHTFATTVCLDHDVPIETVSKMLGHKSIRTTQIYGKVSKKKISNNMNDLERKLFTPEGYLKTEQPPVISVTKKLSAAG